MQAILFNLPFHKPDISDHLTTLKSVWARVKVGRDRAIVLSSFLYPPNAVSAHLQLVTPDELCLTAASTNDRRSCGSDGFLTIFPKPKQGIDVDAHVVL